MTDKIMALIDLLQKSGDRDFLRSVAEAVLRPGVMSMTTETTADMDAIGLGRGGRMSRQRKREGVLRLLWGEELELVSRLLGVTAARLSGWREAFLAAGEAGLATRPTDGAALESDRLKARLGGMLLERELLEAKITALEARDPHASASTPPPVRRASKRWSRSAKACLATPGRSRSRRPGACPSATTTAATTCPRLSRRNLPPSASRVRPPSCARRRATAAPSASSAP
jgi:hypothetical protein